MAEKKDKKIWDEKKNKKDLYTWQPKGMPEMRKPGWIIFLEIMKENFSVLYGSGFIFLISILPGALLFYLSVKEQAILFAILGGLIGGLIGGPTLAGAFDTTLRCMRKDTGYWRTYYVKAWKQNWKQAMQIGAVLGVILCVWAWLVHVMYIADVEVPVTIWISLMLGGALLSMVMQYLFAQLVLLTIKNNELLRNSCLMAVGYLPKSLIAGLFSLFYWGIMVIGMPYTLIFLITTGAWMPVLISWMAIYDPINEIHHVDEKMEVLEEEMYKDLF